MEKIRIGIAGYGNLGRGVQSALRDNPDMQLSAIFSRRPLSAADIGCDVPVVALKDAQDWQDKIDVMIVCSGSANDLPEQVPVLAKWFNTVDSFDTHAKIPEYFRSVNQAAEKAKKTALISVGWDPGLFSLQRLMSESILPDGKSYTFWGKGLSQGHSDAIRRVDGVRFGVQYTIPDEEAMESVRRGEQPELTGQSAHLRQCYIVAEDGADKQRIENEIKNMPNYFLGYRSEVHFIDEEEFHAKHSGMAHGGFVFRSGITGESTIQIMEFALRLGSNPEFTASVLVAYARALQHMHHLGYYGAKTVFDVAPAWLSPLSGEEMRKNLL